LKKDRIVGSILGVISIGFLVMTRMLPKSRFSTTVGPRLFPYLAAGGLLLCAIGLVIKPGADDDRQKAFLDRNGWIRVGKLAAVLIIFPLLFYYTGFIATSLVFLFMMIRMFDLDREVPIWKTAVVTVVITAILYLVFSYLLKIQLPRGEVFTLLKG